MYVPRHFSLPEDYTRKLLAQPRVGNLVTVHAAGPEATMAPFYVDEGANALVTHLVKNNPQVAEPIIGPGLVILDDVDAYVSPRWYATNAVKPNVPTWDYITIHVRGAVRIDSTSEAALTAARRLTEVMEDDDVLTPVGQDKLRRMARAIVAVEVSIVTPRTFAVSLTSSNGRGRTEWRSSSGRCLCHTLNSASPPWPVCGRPRLSVRTWAVSIEAFGTFEALRY